MKFVMNKLMRKILTICVAAFTCISLHAQVNLGAKFNKLAHDFGNVREESETVSTVFTFKNISSKPIRIIKVETTCGCTKPIFSTDSVMPGDSGTIKAIYETRGKDGEFYKNIFVSFNNDAYYQSLSIRGFVIPQANLATKPAEFTTTYSNLAFTNTIAYFPNLLNTEKKDYKIKIYNYMGYAIRIKNIKHKPDYVSVDIGDSLIDVEDTLTVTITVDGTKMSQFGDNTSPISFMTDDYGNEVKFLYVRTILKEDFSKISNKDLKNAPHIKMDTMGPIHFGKHAAGEKFSYTIKVSNTGKKALNIRKIVPSCSCVTFSIAKQVLAPGESVNLVLTIDTVNQMVADLTKYVTITTNDPKNQEIKIKLTMTVTN